MKRIIGLVVLVSLFIIGGLTLGSAIAEEVKSVDDMFKEEKYSEEDYYRTERMLLTATKHLIDSRKAPAIASVVTADEIRDMGARDLIDVLRRVPGLYISNRAVSGQGISTRGVFTAWSEKVLIMIDGHRMNESGYGTWFWICDQLPVENIKRIEVVRGPGSALYGANAFVGVVNVITKTAEDIDGQQFTVGGGSYSTQHYNGLLSYKKGIFEISGQLDFFDTDGPSSLVKEDTRFGKPDSIAPGGTVEDYEQYDVGLNVKVGDLKFAGRMIDKERGHYIGLMGALNDETEMEFSHAYGDLAYVAEITDNLGLTARAYTDYFSYDTYWELYSEGFLGPNTSLIGNPMYKQKTYGAEIQADVSIGDHLITAGFNYETIEQYDVKHRVNFLNPPAGVVDVSDFYNFNQEVTRDIWAVYLQYMWEITAYDTLTVGGRHDNYDDFGGTINPRLGYVHEFKNELTLKALYGSAFKAPTFGELYQINNPSALGNPELNPETIRTYEVSMEYPFMKNYTFRLNYFYNQIEDMIELDRVRKEYVNKSGTNKISGIEAEFAFHFSKSSYGFVNYSYQHGEDDAGDPLPNVPRWMMNMGASQRLAKYFNANLNAYFIGERLRSPADTRDKLSSDVLFDLTVIAKDFFNTLEVRGSIYNIFDTKYRDPSPYPAITDDFPGNERMWLVDIRYKF